MKLDVFGDRTLFYLGPVPVTDTMVITLVVTFALIASAWALCRTMVRRPDGALAALAGWTVEWLDGLVTDAAGRSDLWLLSFGGTLFLFIAGCTLVGLLPGMRAPTASLATTSALAGLVFLVVPAVGVRTHGLFRYFRRYLSPNPVMLPLHLLSVVSRTVALSVRLFGNMMSGHLIVVLLVALVGVLVPTPLMALDLLIGVLQAYIFTILSTVYIGAALQAGEEI
jgi:F-type H+-transporting ATPase subunit a